MRDRSEIKTILGLTQNEMCMLLDLTSGSWSMFKSGLRDIPLTAKTKLANVMDASYKREKASKEIEVLLKEEIKNEMLILKQELLSIELKIKRVSKKMETIRKIRENLLAAYETAVMLESDNSNPTTQLLAETIKIRVTNSLKTHNLATITTLQLKKESLEMLKLKIEQKIKI